MLHRLHRFLRFKSPRGLLDLLQWRLRAKGVSAVSGHLTGRVHKDMVCQATVKQGIAFEGLTSIKLCWDELSLCNQSVVFAC